MKICVYVPLGVHRKRLIGFEESIILTAYTAKKTVWSYMYMQALLPEKKTKY